MGLRKRLCAVVGVLAVCGAVAFTASQTRVLPGVIPENALIAKPTITLWYTDEVLGDYLASVAFDYQEEYDVRVVPVLTSGLEYLEAVNAASLDGNGGPDLYIVSNDSLEKAHLAGLAEEIEDAGNLVTAENFPQAALDAVTYQGNKVAYPLYFETSALVYNSTYLQQAAEELSVSKQDLIPETIDDILAFADEYNAPETVEAVFKWDVSDIFYNYFFAGNYMNAGGACGDDESQIDIYNLEAVKGLTAYQELNQFFSIDAKNSSYDAVVSDFLAGKLVFTVATTDILQSIEQAKADGTFSCEYDVVPLPDVNEEVKTKGFS
ncbi:MAG: extracellular solute-binding protein, partial [Lachnospiraceae bacterium]|nr:extracellular solute-binding protein [Lachnospiraceae bacterium]